MAILHETSAAEICGCLICGERFADPTAWAAHRPWRSRTRRSSCRWPRTLYQSAGVWTLRPAARAAVERAEHGDDWRPATKVATPTPKTPTTRTLRNGASNGAASSRPCVALGAHP